VNAQVALRLAQAHVLTARAALNTLLGRRPNETLAVTGTLRPDVPLWDERQLLEQTLARNPSLKIQTAEIERAGLNLRLVRKSRYPDFTVGPAYESEPGLQIFSFGLSLPVPLWDQKKGPIATAAAEQLSALGELEKLRQEILLGVTSAAQNLAAVKEALANYTPEFIARLKASSDAAAQSYSDGRTPLLLFLETQRTYFETQASYFESLQKLYESRAELESAIGIPLEEISKP
jgi:cobalt-zinc-cadmium efflux system outer membrane protein